MSKQDYELIARTLQRILSKQDYASIAPTLQRILDESPGQETCTCTCTRDVLRRFAEDLSDGLVVDNPRFDRARFLEAAGF